MIHVGNTKEPIKAAISKYANHPSIVNINKIVKHSSFLFEDIQMDEIESELKGHIAWKGNTFKDIPAKLLKEIKNICSEPLFSIVNNGITDSVFDTGLKAANATPVHKGGDTTDKKNVIDQLVYSLLSRKFLKKFISKLRTKWILSLDNSYMDTAKVSTLNTHYLQF